jgi:hypothetical protein
VFTEDVLQFLEALGLLFGALADDGPDQLGRACPLGGLAGAVQSDVGLLPLARIKGVGEALGRLVGGPRARLRSVFGDASACSGGS